MIGNFLFECLDQLGCAFCHESAAMVVASVFACHDWPEVLGFLPDLDGEPRRGRLLHALNDRREDLVRAEVDLQMLSMEVVTWVAGCQYVEFVIEADKLFVMFFATGRIIYPLLEDLKGHLDGACHRKAAAFYDFCRLRELVSPNEFLAEGRKGAKSLVDQFPRARQNRIMIAWRRHQAMAKQKLIAEQKLAQGALSCGKAVRGVADVVESVDDRCQPAACVKVEEGVAASGKVVFTVFLRPKMNSFDGSSVAEILADRDLGILVDKLVDGRYKVKTENLERLKEELSDVAEIEEQSMERSAAARSYAAKRQREESRAEEEALTPRETVRVMQFLSESRNDPIMRMLAEGVHACNSRREGLVKRGVEKRSEKKQRRDEVLAETLEGGEEDLSS